MNIKQKVRMKTRPNFVGVKRSSVLVDLNQDKDAKRFKSQRYSLLKDIIKNYNVIVNGKNFFDWLMIWRRYEEIRKSTTGKGEDYFTECLLDYEYIGQLQNSNHAIIAKGSMFVLMILEKIKQARLKLSQRSVIVL